MMSKNISLRSVYLYLVCFVTLIIFVFGTITTIQRVVDIAVDGGYYYMTLEDYEQRFIVRGSDGNIEQRLTEEELTRRYEDYLKQEKNRAQKNNVRQLASSFSAMVVGGSFWLYHWKKINKDNEEIVRS
ncbi:hypothetical protein [Alkaliphilus peptidifermentans]|uniref:DUF5671 domain-containing protein n=1 Tax=Alkaliphilus peptidifermentans DSM 18978 TaxID=1120976 RepID=A0A1G5I042_9FIRM|nr:hypothetical protein [Alkaliphilus peptidifermentans]SCY69413.1 hypothetical protein SAMN03080606_02183 [Alkaliphilus peptidifermentans DSM 18978]